MHCAAVGYLWLTHWRFTSAAALFLAGVSVLLISLISPLDTLGDTYLFSVHMIQHLLLSYRAAFTPAGHACVVLSGTAVEARPRRGRARAGSPGCGLGARIGDYVGVASARVI